MNNDSQGEYPNRYAFFVGSISRWFLSLPFRVANVLVSLWKETSEERAQRYDTAPCYQRYVLLTLFTPILVILFILSFLPSCLGLLIYFFVRRFRKNICYRNNQLSEFCSDDFNAAESHQILSYSVLSVNTCLLPTFLAKFNNLSHTTHRAKVISQIIDSINDSEFGSDSTIDFVPKEIDFVCLQEAFDRSATDKLLKALKPKYRGLVYQADSNDLLKILNSGLFLASKYAISAIDFVPFTQSASADSLADKGILLIKIDFHLKMPNRGASGLLSNAVGYLFITHLQAETGVRYDEIRMMQMEEIKQAIEVFKQEHRSSTESSVMDILCGDFNTTWEKENCLHGEYIDISCETVCGTTPGVLKMGTLLRQSRIHSSDCNTPAGLKSLISAQLSTDSSLSENLLEGQGQGDQIDHILIHRSMLENKVVALRRYAYVTAFAGYTDHLAVYASFDVLQP